MKDHSKQSDDLNDSSEPTGKRRKILDGALRAFARKGYYNTRISEVATEAGVADGTIYLYFKNKDDLLISLFEDKMEWLIERLSAELDTTKGGFKAKLQAIVNLHAELATAHPELAEFITVELRQSAKFIKEYENLKFQDYLTIIHNLIISGQKEGVVRKDLDARSASRIIFGALDELLLSLTLSRAPTKEAFAYAETVSKIFLDGLICRD